MYGHAWLLHHTPLTIISISAPEGWVYSDASQTTAISGSKEISPATNRSTMMKHIFYAIHMRDIFGMFGQSDVKHARQECISTNEIYHMPLLTWIEHIACIQMIVDVSWKLTSKHRIVLAFSPSQSECCERNGLNTPQLFVGQGYKWWSIRTRSNTYQIRYTYTHDSTNDEAQNSLLRKMAILE